MMDKMGERIEEKEKPLRELELTEESKQYLQEEFNKCKIGREFGTLVRKKEFNEEDKKYLRYFNKERGEPFLGRKAYESIGDGIVKDRKKVGFEEHRVTNSNQQRSKFNKEDAENVGNIEKIPESPVYSPLSQINENQKPLKDSTSEQEEPYEAQIGPERKAEILKRHEEMELEKRKLEKEMELEKREKRNDIREHIQKFAEPHKKSDGKSQQ